MGHLWQEGRREEGRYSKSVYQMVPFEKGRRQHLLYTSVRANGAWSLPISGTEGGEVGGRSGRWDRLYYILSYKASG